MWSLQVHVIYKENTDVVQMDLHADGWDLNLLHKRILRFLFVQKREESVGCARTQEMEFLGVVHVDIMACGKTRQGHSCLL